VVAGLANGKILKPSQQNQLNKKFNKHPGMDILVFVTNVADTKAVSKVKPLLTALPAIKDWNFDLEDCDRILRIVSNRLSPRKVELMLQTAGFDCYELGD